MPIKYVPYIPTPIEGQAVLGNFMRTKRKLIYRGADEIYERILRGMPYYELERVETVGKDNPSDNLLIHGECISTCAYLKDKGIKVDLVYIDPPFASGADYAKKIYIRRNPLVAKAIKKAEEELEDLSASQFEEIMYGDIWDKEKYLNWMYENLMAIKSVMSDTGSIYVHLDWHIGHYVKILMDEIFGEDNFKNELIWKYFGPTSGKNNYPHKHDNIYYYCLSNEGYFNFDACLVDYDEKAIKRYDHIDENGKRYKIYNEKDGTVRRAYMNEGTPTEVFEIPGIQNPVYGTQKPDNLLERIIKASSEENQVVADFFGGSGVTAAVAHKLNRKFITCDVGVNSIQIIRDKLMSDKASFEIYEIKDGVNLFRNPVQTMNKIVKLIPGLQVDNSLPKFWTGYFTDSKNGKIPVYIQDLKDSSSKIFDIVKLNEIINEHIPALEEKYKKVVVYYVDISDFDELNSFIKDNNLSGTEIEFRDLKSILALTFEEDYLDYEVVEESSSIFSSKQLVIKKFISDRLKQKIDEFNDKAIAQAIEHPENAKTIKLSKEGLEGIEMISVDCTSTEGEWHSDAEIKVEKDNTVTLNGDKSKEGWDGKVPLTDDPKRIKVRNILGDETIIIV
ncbi:MAG: site-specific DNA-methyltransferase [Erysipelotrichaceae bacterium]|nr:site-specific DNA-methyltransferase [Erysipelotrichaceae bacterium]